MTRLFANLSIDQLNAMAERNWGNASELDLVLGELRHRKTHAAIELHGRVKKRISELKRNGNPGEDAGRTPSSDSAKVISLPKTLRRANGLIKPSPSCGPSSLTYRAGRR